jgi:hypothetical protein
LPSTVRDSASSIASATRSSGIRVVPEDVVATLTAPHAVPSGDALDRELQSWSRSRDDPTGMSPLVLRLAVLTWTRVHGIVGLELTGALARMGLDPGLLLDDDVRRLVAEAQLPPTPRRSIR